MLRIPPSQFLSHLRIRALPEAAQVTGHLDRPAVRRKQREHHGLATRPDRRRFGEAEELLQFHRCGDGSVAVVDKRNGSPARHLKPCWRVAVERANNRRLQRASQIHLRQRTSAIRGGADQRTQVDRVAGKLEPSQELGIRLAGLSAQTTPPPAVRPPTRPRSAPGVRAERARRSARRSRREPPRCRDRTTVRSARAFGSSQSRSIRLAIRMRLSAAGSTRGAVRAACQGDGRLGRPSRRPARQPRRETLLQPRRSPRPTTAPAPDASLTRGDAAARRLATRSGYPARIARRKSCSLIASAGDPNRPLDDAANVARRLLDVMVRGVPAIDRGQQIRGGRVRSSGNVVAF